jgi:hypothetical protein
MEIKLTGINSGEKVLTKPRHQPHRQHGKSNEKQEHNRGVSQCNRQEVAVAFAKPLKPLIENLVHSAKKASEPVTSGAGLGAVQMRMLSHEKILC